MTKFSIPLYNLVAGIIGIGLSLASLYILESKFEIFSQLSNFQNLNYLSILFFILFYLLALLVKPMRFIGHLEDSTYQDYRSGFYIGNLLNNVLPFRLGDLLRVFFFLKIKKSKTLFLILFEKILDLISLVAFLAIFLLWFYGYSIFLIGVCIFIFLIVMTIFIQTSIKSRLAENIFFQRSWIINLRIFFVTLVAWFFEGSSYAVFFYIIESLDLSLGFSFMPISALSSLIPSAPGYIGVINYTMVSWGEFIDLPASLYAYYSFLIVFLMWITTCIIGTVFLIRAPRIVKNFFNTLYGS